MIAATPEPPYYAVIFSSQRSEGDQGYEAMSDRMVELAAQQPGFLGVESVRDGAGFGITVSYWKDAESIRAWRMNAEHLEAQSKGRSIWYQSFRTRVCKVEREGGGR